MWAMCIRVKTHSSNFRAVILLFIDKKKEEKNNQIKEKGKKTFNGMCQKKLKQNKYKSRAISGSKMFYFSGLYYLIYAQSTFTTAPIWNQYLYELRTMCSKNQAVLKSKHKAVAMYVQGYFYTF